LAGDDRRGIEVEAGEVRRVKGACGCTDDPAIAADGVEVIVTCGYLGGPGQVGGGAVGNIPDDGDAGLV